MRLVISATPLIDRWSVTSAPRRDRIDWPPSPDTLFSALVAAAASIGNACPPALYWLETLGNPTIEAGANPPRVEGIQSFCPVADLSMFHKKSRKAREHNSIGDPSPVSWSWRIDTPEHFGALEKIVREVTYIGSSRGPVLATAFISDAPTSPDALVPDAQGRHRIRGIYPGRLDELEAAFQAGNRPPATQTVGYARPNEQRVEAPWAKMIPLRRVAGQALHLAYSVPITEAIRHAITRHLPHSAPGTLTGHDRDGAALRGPHMAVVPLPRVRDQFADGEVLGVGLLPPRFLSDGDFSELIGGLGRWLAAGGHVSIGRIPWTMEVAHGDHRLSLRDTRYGGLTDTWASVTPVVFDRHPRRNLSLSHVVNMMCREVGLPPPEHVEASPSGSLKGCVDSHRHGLGTRDYLRRHLIAHVRIKWPRRVPGPILIGRGRYFGLGVMLPMWEAA